MKVLRFFLEYGRKGRKERKYAARILKAALIKEIGRKYNRNNRPLILSGLPELTDMFYLDVLWKKNPDPDFIEIMEYITEVLPELKIKGATPLKYRPKKRPPLITDDTGRKTAEDEKNDKFPAKIYLEIGTITPIIIEKDGSDAADLAVGIKRKIIPPIPEKITLPEYLYLTSPFIGEDIIQIPGEKKNNNGTNSDPKVTLIFNKISTEELEKVADPDKLEIDSITTVGFKFKMKTEPTIGEYGSLTVTPGKKLNILLTAAEYMLPASAVGDGIPYIKVIGKGRFDGVRPMPKKSDEIHKC